jgi:hypothetical protein
MLVITVNAKSPMVKSGPAMMIEKTACNASGFGRKTVAAAEQRMLKNKCQRLKCGDGDTNYPNSRESSGRSRREGKNV